MPAECEWCCEKYVAPSRLRTQKKKLDSEGKSRKASLRRGSCKWMQKEMMEEREIHSTEQISLGKDAKNEINSTGPRELNF